MSLSHLQAPRPSWWLILTVMTTVWCECGVGEHGSLLNWTGYSALAPHRKRCCVLVYLYMSEFETSYMYMYMYVDHSIQYCITQVAMHTIEWA